MEFSARQWLPDLGQDAETQPGYDGFFQQEDGQLFIKLNPLDLLRHHEATTKPKSASVKPVPKKQ